MNIPDEGFFTLLTQGMRNRTVETLQRALYHTLRDAILQGTLTARCRLPGSRVMAERLHLSRNTVNAALEQLALEGYLTRSRQGTQVAPLASCRQEAGQMPPVVLPERLQRLPAAMRRDSPTLAFTPGRPAVYPADRHHRRRAGRSQLMRLATDQPGRQRVAGRTGVPGGEEWLSAGGTAGQRNGCRR